MPKTIAKPPSAQIYSNMKRDYQFFQVSENGCGYAAVKMLIAHEAKTSRYRYLPEPKVEEKAPALSDLIKYAGQHGLELKAYRLPSPSQISQNHEFPLLCLLRENGLLHLVYLRSHRFGRYQILDPAQGKRSLKEGEFLRLFTGVILQAASYKPRGNPPKPPSFGVGAERIAAGLVQSLSLVVIFIGFYFVDSEIKYPLAFVLLAAYVGLQAISQVLTLRAMRRFDVRYLDGVARVPIGDRSLGYRHYLSFKAMIISRFSSFATTVLDLLVLTAMFASSDPYLGMALSGLYLLLLADVIFCSSTRRGRLADIDRMEKEVLGEIPPSGKSTNLFALSEAGTRYAMGLNVRKGIYAAVELALAFLVTYFSKQFSLNHLLFCFMGLNALGEEADRLGGAIFQNEEYRKEEAYFLGHFVEAHTCLKV